MGKLTNRILYLWSYLTGDPTRFSLESRIYNSICIIGLPVIAYNIPFNLFLGLPLPALITSVLLVIQSFTYYLSRFRGKVSVSIVISGIMIYSLFGLNYYFNSGIDGPSLLLLALAFFLVITTVPARQYPVWFALNLILVNGLLLAEYHFPGFIVRSYSNELNRFTDTASAYAIVLVLVYFGTAFLVNNYRREKAITEEKAKELERLNGEKDKLFSIISHDIKAPLSSILNYLELLTIANLEEGERVSLSKELLLNTRMTQEMLMNILSWSKTQMEGTSANIRSVNVSRSLKSTFELSNIIALKKKISLGYRIPSDIQVLADEDMLQLIMRNLINNALKFTNESGRVDIEAFADDDRCTIIVMDNGTGIKEEQKPKIFSLQAKSTYGTINEKGIGLGLVLCKDFTEMQNGKIWFESEPGKGTAFYVSFPLA